MFIIKKILNICSLDDTNYLIWLLGIYRYHSQVPVITHFTLLSQSGVLGPPLLLCIDYKGANISSLHVVVEL